VKLRDRILAIADRRPPDFIIGGADRPYLLRWWIIPRNPVFNAYLHCFLRSDDDRAHHCHPWLFRLSWLLKHRYIAHHIWKGGVTTADLRELGSLEFRWGASPHRVELLGGAEPEPCWTLFITGPRIREWGFHCPKGWIHWTKFTDSRDSGAVGKGCDQ
jgi:hypothetical protein